MRAPTLSLIALAAISTTAAFAAPPDPGPSAEQVMSAAKSRAATEHKNILLTFSASWCGPCHMWERMLNEPSIKPIMDKAFVEARLDVGERPNDPRHADSPGAVAYETTIGGKEPGYPFIVMLDAGGTPITNSLRNGKKGANIGYPALPVEIDWFMKMLAQAAPSLTPQETDTVRKYLVAHAKD